MDAPRDEDGGKIIRGFAFVIHGPLAYTPCVCF
jgi:hypothetical protein